jgi:endonuclease III
LPLRLDEAMNENVRERDSSGRVVEIVRRLEKAYGPEHRHPGGDPVSTLIETILSQNTSDLNSGRAFVSLRTEFPRWEDVAEADPERIASAIRAGGLAQVKGRRIKDVLQAIKEASGSLNLGFLNSMNLDDAREWLKGLPGVGDKTAACVLLFSFGRPALPVDTHIHRVAGRLGLIGSAVSAEKAHALLGALVPSRIVLPFHVLMIEHGRRTCHPRHPACPSCAIGDLCPSCGLIG